MNEFARSYFRPSRAPWCVSAEWTYDVQGVIARATKLILYVKREGWHLILFWGKFLTPVLYSPGPLDHGKGS